MAVRSGKQLFFLRGLISFNSCFAGKIMMRPIQNLKFRGVDLVHQIENKYGGGHCIWINHQTPPEQIDFVEFEQHRLLVRGRETRKCLSSKSDIAGMLTDRAREFPTKGPISGTYKLLMWKLLDSLRGTSDLSSEHQAGFEQFLQSVKTAFQSQGPDHHHTVLDN
jgi:hypothetical protein